MAEIFEAEIADLAIAPVKSMEMIDVDALQFDEDGLFGDREFMLVEDGTGVFISQRRDPILTQFEVGQTSNGTIVLKYRTEGKESQYYLVPVEETDENTIDVSVHKWKAKATDQGEGAAHWASEILGRDVRIVRRSEKFPRFANDDAELGKVGFADGFPLLVGSLASIEMVSEWLEEAGENPTSAKQFRPNLLLGQGVEAFGEDMISTLRLCVDGLEIVLEKAKACDRCLIIDTDQTTGERKAVDGKPAQPVMHALKENGRAGRGVGYGDKRGTFMFQNFVVKEIKGLEPGQVIEIPKTATLVAAMASHPNWVPLDR